MSSLAIQHHLDDQAVTPEFYVEGGRPLEDRKPYAVVKVLTPQGGTTYFINDPAQAFAIADAFLAAGQQLEQLLERAAAAGTNAAFAEQDSQPFGTEPAQPVQHIAVEAPAVDGTDVNARVA